MRILKQEVIKTLKDVNGSWVKALKRAEENNEPLDTSEVIGQVIDKIADLDDKFEEYKVRKDKPEKKKGGFLS